MRDRLAKLLEDSPYLSTLYNEKEEYLKAADHLLASGVIVPPCKVEGRVYYLTSVDTEKELNIADIFCGTVKSVTFDGKNIWISVKYTNGLYYCHKSQEFGRDVFLTKEQAEKALAERRKT